MFRKITLFSVVLALIVSVFGCYMRLSDALPGCPDWAECYGDVVISDKHYQKLPLVLEQISALFDAGKNMLYRYLIAGLALLILVLGVLGWRGTNYRLSAMLTISGLFLLVALQALLNVWMPDALMLPTVAAANLLLGMISFWLLFWLYLRSGPAVPITTGRPVSLTVVLLAMLVLWIQIKLGAWESVNHAALACAGFPLCNGQWWPDADYQNALNVLAIVHDALTGYTGDISANAQVAINWLHRVGALLCFIVLTLLAFASLSTAAPRAVRKAGLWLSVLLFVQIGLGSIGYKLMLPLWATLAHHTVAALLMLPLIAIGFYNRYGFVESVGEVSGDKALRPPAAAFSVDTLATVPGVAPYIEPAPETLYLRLKSQLKRTRSGLGDLLANLSLGRQETDDDLLEDLEASLLMADIGITVTTEIINRLTQHLERHQLKDTALLSAALKQELLRILKPCSNPLQIPKQDKPFVILVVGVNGAGKTTTIGKLARRLQAQGHSVMLAAGDTFRAAAVEQLQIWGERNGIHVVAQHTGADSASVIYDGVQSAQAKGIDVLIADTAGRLHTKANLMDELKKVKRIISKLDETAPHEVLLVLDAGTGQNALSQAKLFNETVALTGLVLTKLDGTAKGGVIFALAGQSGIPIRYIGIGEGIDDLQDFDAETFVDALFVKD
ncbi:MAG: signal recognition particle-docking protein FtsY [Methylovulum sp.]|nr:signal recognition particle-docking protein FtsY [Methylovulum sp.]